MRWSRVTTVLLFALSAGVAHACIVANHCGCLGTKGCLEIEEPPVPAVAQTAFKDGKYVIAATVAEAKGTIASLTLAAAAYTAQGMTQGSPRCLECYLKAEAAAEAAIAAGASSTEPNAKQALALANIQLAIAIGFHGRMLGAIEAQSLGLAEKGRKAIDRALELDPANPWALAALGGWHLEIVQRGGPILASALYGASEKEGLKKFHAALAADPGNPLLNYHFALSILALDTDRFDTEARVALTAAEQGRQSGDALTKFTAGHASLLLAVMLNGDARQIKALVRVYQGYPSE